MEPLLVTDAADLTAVRSRYLQAVEEGADSLVVDFRPGAHGLDPQGVLATLSLAPVGGPAPQIDLTLRGAGGLAVLAGVPLQAVARRVVLERLAIAGPLFPAIAITAQEIELRDVIVLGAQPDERRRAVVELCAAGPEALQTVQRTVIARCTGRDATLACSVRSGAWLNRLSIEDATIADGAPDAVLSVEAVRELDLRGCVLRAGAARTLMRMDWPAERMTIEDCTLSAPADRLLERRNPAPVPIGPATIGGASRLTAALAELPGYLVAGEGTGEISGERVDALIRERVDAATAAVLAADGRLERLIG
jgi:hypothetical protein